MVKTFSDIFANLIMLETVRIWQTIFYFSEQCCQREHGYSLRWKVKNKSLSKPHIHHMLVTLH